MPNELLVHPGDLITADLWNKLLLAIDRVDKRIDDAEARIVPDVVGDLLPIALDEITNAGLGFSTILDTEGTRVVNTTDAAVASRIVLAQMPSQGDRVEIGRRVALVITAARAVNANRPDITQVNTTPPGGNAQVGKGLEIIGTAFTSPLSVTIGKTILSPGEFKVDSATKITVPAVPAFDGQPGPGQTLAVGVGVTNSNGSDTFSVNFFKPGVTGVQPRIDRVYFLQGGNQFFLSIQGASFSQTGLSTTVTVGGATLAHSPDTSGGLVVPLPETFQSTLRNIQPAVLPLLLEIDSRDLFLLDGLPATPTVRDNLVDIGVVTGGTVSSNPALRRAGEIQPVNSAGTIAARPNTIPTDTLFVQRFDLDLAVPIGRNPGKLFLVLGPQKAAAIVNQFDNPRIKPSAALIGNNVTVTAGNVNFTVDATKLADIPIVVTVGDKASPFFRLKMGAFA